MDRDNLPEAIRCAQEPVAPLLGLLESVWRGARGSRAMPSRPEIDAAAIEPVLPWVFTAEAVAPGVLRLRIAGQRFTELLRMEPRGMPLCALFTPEGRAALAPLVEQVLTQPALVEMPLRSSRGLMRPRLTGRLLILPLTRGGRGAGRLPDMVIGALVCDRAPGALPVRFDPGEGPVRIETLTAGPNRPCLAVESAVRRHLRPAHPPPALRLVASNP